MAAQDVKYEISFSRHELHIAQIMNQDTIEILKKSSINQIS